MPRRNKTPKTTRKSLAALAHSSDKKAFASKQQAERAAKEAMRYNVELELHVYQSPLDGKWYLSSSGNN